MVKFVKMNFVIRLELSLLPYSSTVSPLTPETTIANKPGSRRTTLRHRGCEKSLPLLCLTEGARNPWCVLLGAEDFDQPAQYGCMTPKPQRVRVANSQDRRSGAKTLPE